MVHNITQLKYYVKSKNNRLLIKILIFNIICDNITTLVYLHNWNTLTRYSKNKYDKEAKHEKNN